jgi:ferric-dicitrate binding protein FerR (iron transport regulator)
MSCERFHRRVDDLLDGRLGPEEAEALRAHCDECPGCAAMLESAESFARRMSDHFRSFDAGDARAAARLLVESLPSAPPPRAGLTPLRLVALAAAAAVLLAVSVFLALRDPGGNVSRIARVPDPSRREAATTARVVSGEVLLMRPDGETVASASAQALALGVPFRVGGDAAAEIAIGEKALVFLDAGAEAVLVAPEDGRAGAPTRAELRLVAGKLYAEVERDDGAFVVQTDRGRVTTLGTKFGVSLDAREDGTAELAVAVEEGAVRVDRDGASEVVSAGTCGVFRGGQAPCWERGEACGRRLGWAVRCRRRRRGECRGGENGSRGRGRGRAQRRRGRGAGCHDGEPNGQGHAP